MIEHLFLPLQCNSQVKIPASNVHVFAFLLCTLSVVLLARLEWSLENFFPKGVTCDCCAATMLQPTI